MGSPAQPSKVEQKSLSIPSQGDSDLMVGLAATLFSSFQRKLVKVSVYVFPPDKQERGKLSAIADNKARYINLPGSFHHCSSIRLQRLPRW
jgi:hypothetical protein